MPIGDLKLLPRRFGVQLNADSEERFIRPVHCVRVAVPRVHHLLKYEEWDWCTTPRMVSQWGQITMSTSTPLMQTSRPPGEETALSQRGHFIWVTPK